MKTCLSIGHFWPCLANEPFKPRTHGGLALPDFQLNYLAANLRSMLYWLNTDPDQSCFAWAKLKYILVLNHLVLQCFYLSVRKICHCEVQLKNDFEFNSNNFLTLSTLRFIFYYGMAATFIMKEHLHHLSSSFQGLIYANIKSLSICWYGTPYKSGKRLRRGAFWSFLECISFLICARHCWIQCKI